MKIIVFLITISTIFCDQSSPAHNGIKCYSCSTKDSIACLHPEKNRMELKTCKLETMNEMKELVVNVDSEMQPLFEVHVPPDFHFDCMKQVTKVSDKEYVIRGCQPAQANEELDICKALSKKKFAKSNVTHCSLCTRDGCNGTRNVHSSDFTRTFLFSFALFVVKLAM